LVFGNTPLSVRKRRVVVMAAAEVVVVVTDNSAGFMDWVRVNDVRWGGM
jgi:hypothetical protein